MTSAWPAGDHRTSGLGGHPSVPATSTTVLDQAVEELSDSEFSNPPSLHTSSESDSEPAAVSHTVDTDLSESSDTEGLVCGECDTSGATATPSCCERHATFSGAPPQVRTFKADHLVQGSAKEWLRAHMEKKALRQAAKAAASPGNDRGKCGPAPDKAAHRRLRHQLVLRNIHQELALLEMFHQVLRRELVHRRPLSVARGPLV